MVSLVSQVPKVSQETEVLQEALALDLRDLQERKVSRASQEDLADLVHLVLKVNQASQCPRKAYQDPEDWMESQDCLDHQVTQVSPDRMVSLVYQERRVTLDSQALDFQDPQALKVSQVSLASQDLLEDQEDQEWMDSPASLDSLDQRVSLALAFLDPQVCQECLDLKVSLDQREILVSLAAPVHPDDLDLMADRELKVSPVALVYLELVAHLDLPQPAHWGSQAPLDPLDQWDHQARKDSLDQTERRETPVLQV